MIKTINPKFIFLCNRFLQPWLAYSCAALTVWGLSEALWFSPPDYQQKESVRILYIHVPAAWLGMGAYGMMGALSLIGFISGNRLWFLLARALAPIGLCYTLICLATGMIWGSPIWGTWWVWDARLTSMAVLALLYVGYLMAESYVSRQNGGDKVGGVIVLIGCLNLPIIKWSVDWWNTLHQPAGVLRMSGSALHGSMLKPLFIMALSFALLTGALWLKQSESLLLRKKIKKTLMLLRYKGQ